MKVADYPVIYKAASQESDSAQCEFVLTTACHLIVLVCAAIAACIPSPRFGLSSALMLGMGLALSLAHRFRKADDRWFACRAVAENVKSASWSYVMDSGDEAKARARLLSEISATRSRFPERDAPLAGSGVSGEAVTAWMREARQQSLQKKKGHYLDARIQDQIAWYTEKSAHNAKCESRWGLGILVLELGAVTLGVIAALCAWQLNPAGFLAAIAAAGIAWAQTKRYSDLATTYRVAAEDLQGIRDGVPAKLDESGLRKLVSEVEKSISREHSIWRHQRGIT